MSLYLSKQGRKESTSINLAFQEAVKKYGKDGRVVPANMKEVHQCLLPVSTRWYTIGMYLNIPVHILNEIEADKTDTDRKLIAMIAAWINTGEATWSGLISAVQLLKVDIKLENTQHSAEELTSETSIWKQKEIEMVSYEATYNILYSLKKESSDEHLRNIRRKVDVPDSVSDEALLLGMVSYTFWNAIENLIRYVSHGLPQIAIEFQHDRECLLLWGKRIISQSREVQGQVSKLKEEKEELKEYLIMAVAGRTPQRVIDNTPERARDILNEIDEVNSYSDLLSNQLIACERMVWKSLHENKIYQQILSNTKRGLLIMTISYFLVYFIFTQLIVQLYTKIYHPVPPQHLLVFMMIMWFISYFLQLKLYHFNSKWHHMLSSLLQNKLVITALGITTAILTANPVPMIASTPSPTQQPVLPTNADESMQTRETESFFFSTLFATILNVAATVNRHSFTLRIVSILYCLIIIYSWEHMLNNYTLLLAGILGGILLVLTRKITLTRAKIKSQYLFNIVVSSVLVVLSINLREMVVNFYNLKEISKEAALVNSLVFGFIATTSYLTLSLMQKYSTSLQTFSKNINSLNGFLKCIEESREKIHK